MQETLVGFLDREDLLEKGQATHFSIWGFPGGSDGKESACSAGDLGSITGLGRSPGEYMATHSSILAWRIPWIEEPGGLQSTDHKELGMTERLTHTFSNEESSKSESISHSVLSDSL